MQDPKLAPLLKMVSFVFILMPVISLLRGFFQGTGEMLQQQSPKLVNNLYESSTILATAIFLSIHQSSLYVVGAGAVFGSITGGLISVIILLFFWLRSREERLKGEINLQQGKKIIKAFTIHALPICISSMLLVLLQLADSLNLFSLLVNSRCTGE